MSERVIVRQNDEYEIEILAQDPHIPDAQEFHAVEQIHQLTPYGMLLASLGACTAIVLHTYAEYHDVELHEVEVRLRYDRVFGEDCEKCETIHEFEESIEYEILLPGDLTSKQRNRLFAVSKQCPIHKMLGHGIDIRSRLSEDAAPAEVVQ